MGSNGSMCTTRRGSVSQGSCPWLVQGQSCHTPPATEFFLRATCWRSIFRIKLLIVFLFQSKDPDDGGHRFLIVYY